LSRGIGRSEVNAVEWNLRRAGNADGGWSECFVTFQSLGSNYGRCKFDMKFDNIEKKLNFDFKLPAVPNFYTNPTNARST
jgi:hypothetical protein